MMSVISMINYYDRIAENCVTESKSKRSKKYYSALRLDYRKPFLRLKLNTLLPRIQGHPFLIFEIEIVI